MDTTRKKCPEEGREEKYSDTKGQSKYLWTSARNKAKKYVFMGYVSSS